jgi:hypothetical protein
MWGLVKSVLSGGGLVGEIFGGIKDHFQHKRELNKAIALAKQKLITTQQTADINWDQLMAEGSKNSWKDEFWTIVLAIPAVLVFLPSMSAHIAQGFAVLETMPDWYKAALGVAISAAFGVSKFQQVMNGKKK